MDTLPLDLIFEILSRLPVKSLLRFKFVCKSWKNLITTAMFTNLHLRHSSAINTNRFAIIHSCCTNDIYLIDIDTPQSLALKLPIVYLPLPFSTCPSIASCNGLVSFCTRRTCPEFIVLNPLTRTHFRFLGPQTFFNWISFGFGYDHMNDDYKFVLLGSRESFIKVMIYSLKERTWRSVDDDDDNVNFSMFPQFKPGALLDNHLLHWNVLCRKSNTFEIACLDICSEKWNMILGPYGYLLDALVTASVYNGCLCLFPRCYGAPSSVWLLKEYGVRESWIMLDMNPSSPAFNSLFCCRFVDHGITNDGGSELSKLTQRGITEPGERCGECDNGHKWWVEIFTGSLVTVGNNQNITTTQYNPTEIDKKTLEKKDKSYRMLSFVRRCFCG